MNSIKENSDKLQAIAPEVARELGRLTLTCGWRVVTDAECQHYVELHGTGGSRDRVLVLSVAYHGAGNDGKLRAYGKFDPMVEGKSVWWHDNGKNPAAFIALTKAPKQIAADIFRRVLPGYLPLLAECEARKSSYVLHTQSVFEVAEKLAREFGGDVSTRRDPSRPEVNFYRVKTFGGTFPDLKVNNADEVTFENLTVTPEVAHKILGLLRDQVPTDEDE